MKSLYELKEKLCGELDELAAKPDMSLYDLDTVHKLTDTIKNIDKIMMLEDGGYSQADGRMRENRNSYGGGSYGGSSYNDGGGSYSQARREQHYVRGHYSRDDGRSDMVNRLEAMMHEAGSDRDREAIRRLMEEMRNA